MNEFSIEYDDGRQTTFADLLAFQEEGFSVVRSPHMPLNTANLGVAMLGLRTIAYGDVYLGSAEPNKEVIRNRPTQLGDTKLAGVPGVKTMLRFIEADAEDGRTSTLSQIHAVRAANAVDTAVVETWEEYVARHRELYRMIIDIAVEQGLTFKDAVDTASGAWLPWQKQQLAVDNVLDTRSSIGVMAVAPLECKLALMFVAEALDTGRERVYHLGGRDMEQYLPAKTGAITGLVTELQDRGEVSDLHVTVATTAGTKIVAQVSDVDQLNEFWSLVGERTADAKHQKKHLLQQRDTKLVLGRSVSITDAAVLGGEGIAITKQALTIPIKAIRHTLRNFQ